MLNNLAADEMVEDNFYLIQNGEYKISTTNFHTSKQIGHIHHQEYIGTLNKNQFFGEVALLLGTQRSAQIESRNYGCLTALPGHVFKNLCNEYPMFQKLLMHRIQYKYDDNI